MRKNALWHWLHTVYHQWVNRICKPHLKSHSFTLERMPGFYFYKRNQQTTVQHLLHYRCCIKASVTNVSFRMVCVGLPHIWQAQGSLISHSHSIPCPYQSSSLSSSFQLQWNLVIKRSDITKPSYNKVILLVPPLYISLFFYPDICYTDGAYNRVSKTHPDTPLIFMVRRTSL